MNVALSPDGHQAAVDRFDTDPAIWLIDITRATTTRATFGKSYESTPVWAPDGQSFVFASAREAPPNLFLKRLDVAGDDQRLFRSTIQSFPQSWSRDGLIAFVVVDPRHPPRHLGRARVRGARATTAHPARRFQKCTRGFHQTAGGSHSSRTRPASAACTSLAFQRRGRSGRSRRRRRFPVWRADSRELFYRAPDGKLMAVADRRRGRNSKRARLAALRRTRLAQAPRSGHLYDVAKDGRFLINMQVERMSPRRRSC